VIRQTVARVNLEAIAANVAAIRVLLDEDDHAPGIIAVVKANAYGHGAAQVALAITGIAGPTGGTAEKPVGTVWFAWAARGRATRSERRRFDGDREAVRRQAVAHALDGLSSFLGSRS